MAPAIWGETLKRTGQLDLDLGAFVQQQDQRHLRLRLS